MIQRIWLMSVKYNLFVIYKMDYITTIKKMIEFFLKSLMERFYPTQTYIPIPLQKQTTKPAGYKSSLSSQYNDDAERMAYIRRVRITGL